MRGRPVRERSRQTAAQRVRRGIRAAAVVLTLGLPSVASAHPPVSLVLDGRGNLYFSDLRNVRVLRPDGSIEVAVSDVHTHELWLGPDGAVYGEDVTNVGDDYRHRVWRIEPDGTVTDVISWRDGYPDEHHDYGFQRDARGNTFVLRRDARSIEVRDPARALLREIPLQDTVGFLHWLTVSPDGLVHVAIGPDLYRVEPGEASAEVVARDLVERTPEFDFVHDRHALMGMWTDARGAICVSVYSGQVVKCVSPRGEVTDLVRSSGKWSPVGGRIRPAGGHWLLEWSSDNEVRVRAIAADGTERFFEAS
ncbi:MAG: hypothetical protein M8872_11900 [marine benthic group bacterium]|nr:hypothetical protein [Gemmatimonadota bacterium]